MATPTIDSVTPATVWTGGQLVTVLGSNFRPPTIPTYYLAGPYPAPKPSVSVMVDGVAAKDVRVMADGELTCRLPPHAPGTAAIVVQNLDDDGVAIPGESATLAAAVTYARPDLTATGDIERVNAKILQMLREQVIDNVSNYVSVDINGTTADVAPVSELPAITLGLPDIPKVSPWRQSSPTYTNPTGTTYERRRAPSRVNLEYTLVGTARSNGEWLGLQDAVEAFFRANPRVEIDRDPNDSSKGTIAYPMDVSLNDRFSNTSTPNSDDARSFSVPFTIYGVLREALRGFDNEDLDEKGGTVETITVRPSTRF